ncbi:MAG TPA: type VII secretion integral membrane protein EccD [Micromonosporaceae bacterium]|nr:type VII secretion integral membrane protein EccD [Micromonosporaceae bacterium]
MAAARTDLVRVTVETPDRRVDVALPDRVPVATLLPALLAAGGDELADRGALHAGWVLRGTTGTPIDTGQGLADQGVRDGDVLCLGYADESWPELDYDDAVEVIALGASRRGRRWDGRATRAAAIVAAVVLYAAAIVAIGSSGPPWTVPTVAAFAFGALLIAASVVAARAYRDVGVGTLLGALALPYAFLGGALAGHSLAGAAHSVTGGAREPLTSLANTPAELAVGSVVVIVFAIAAALGVGRVRPAFVAAGVAGFGGLVDAIVGLSATPVRAAAVVLGVLVLFAGLVPSLAARLGGLPRPRVAAPPATGAALAGADPYESTDGLSSRARSGPVDTSALFTAVSRTDDMLTGLLIGVALAAAAAAVVLAVGGGWPGRLLLLAAAGAFALRGRMYAALRHRAVVLATAGLVAAPLVGVGIFAGAAALPLAAVIGVAGLITIGLGAANGDEERTPHLGRLADLAEVVSLAAIVPLVCVVLGLYARLRGLHL